MRWCALLRFDRGEAIATLVAVPVSIGASVPIAWEVRNPVPLAIGVVLSIAILFGRRTVIVRPDGVAFRVLGRERFVPFSSAKRVERTVEGGALVLKNGERLPLRAAMGHREVHAPGYRADDLVERVDDGLDAFRAAEESAARASCGADARDR